MITTMIVNAIATNSDNRVSLRIIAHLNMRSIIPEEAKGKDYVVGMGMAMSRAELHVVPCSNTDIMNR